MRRALAALVLAAAAASIPGAAAGRGIGLSASPLRLTLRGASAAAVTVRNPGRRALLVDVSRAGFARSLRGQAAGAAGSRRRELAPDAPAAVPARARREEGSPRPAVPSRRAAPGDHPALVLLTTRPLGVKHVRVRLRVGVIVVLRVRGRIVRRLDARALTVRRSGALRLLELRLVNRGNVTERLAGDGLRLSLLIRRPEGRDAAAAEPGAPSAQRRHRGVRLPRTDCGESCLHGSSCGRPCAGRGAHSACGCDR